MCVYSAVMDHFEPMIPDPAIFKPSTPHVPFPTEWFKPNTNIGKILTLEDIVIEGKTITEWKKLIADFKAASEAAKVVDKLTAQPDCEDPEKLKLVDRVRRLEEQLAKIAETVGVST